MFTKNLYFCIKIWKNYIILFIIIVYIIIQIFQIYTYLFFLIFIAYCTRTIYQKYGYKIINILFFFRYVLNNPLVSSKFV